MDLVSLRLSTDPGLNNRLEFVTAGSTSDKGNIHQIKYIRALNNRLEFDLGFDLFEGPSDSQFGSLRQASRGYIQLRAIEIF